MRLQNITSILQIIGVAAAAAIKFSPASAAFRFFIHIGFGEKQLFFSDLASRLIRFPFSTHPSQQTDGRVNIALRRDCNIFIAAAAPAQPFDGARALGQDPA